MRQGHYTLDQIQSTLKLEGILQGHSGSVSSVAWISNEEIITSSIDCTIRLWKENKYSKVWESTVTLGQLSSSRNGFFGALYSPGIILGNCYTGGFYAWKNEENEWKPLKFTISGHTSAVTNVKVYKNLIISGSLDQTSRMFLYNNGCMEVSRPLIHGYDINTFELTKDF